VPPDSPRRGHLRALLPDARSYSPELGLLCLLASLDHEAIAEQEALRAAAELACESHGLAFERLREDDVSLRGLRPALDEAVRIGEARRVRGRVLRSPSDGA
jgi:hypothetical protein